MMKNSVLKLEAIESLGQIKATAALAKLYPHLENPDIRIQTTTARALAQIASPGSIPHLRTVSS
jgi:HEAT repeat protein